VRYVGLSLKNIVIGFNKVPTIGRCDKNHWCAIEIKAQSCKY